MMRVGLGIITFYNDEGGALGIITFYNDEGGALGIITFSVMRVGLLA